MSIKYIFNGYYRSGTTLIWDILKKSNPNYLVFYEPLHPDLFKKINYNRKHGFGKDRLHEKNLWEEYSKPKNNFISKLKSSFYNGNYPNSYNELKKYLDQFDILSSNTILQTNRLHFFTDYVIQDYKPNFIYIIRNPINVYSSLMNIYKNKGIIKNIFVGFFLFLRNGYNSKSKVFSIDQTLEYIYSKYKIPKFFGNNKEKYELLNTPFKAHLVSWVLCNYIGLKESDINTQNLIVYEDLINNPDNIKKRIESNFSLSFNISNVKTEKSNLNIYKSDKIIRSVEELNLLQEYNYILNKMELDL